MDREFLEISSGKQTALLWEIKKHSNISWKKMAQILGVKRRMIFLYLNEKNRAPYFRMQKLCTETNFGLEKLNSIPCINIKWNSRNYSLKPKMNEEFAEFLGALSGDGNIYMKKYRISITCNAISDYEYVTDIVRKKFMDLFGLETTITKENGGIRCKCYLLSFSKNVSKSPT